ncbi:MAG TPA: hypothetical protein VE956_00490 [Nodularia sp. (in: cyanobacteria)]|nr:hypothetical protein [Nodularia sp. (in: cyanobacteria)]
MKIAEVAPLWERVPPPSYGGIELVVSHLTDELVRQACRKHIENNFSVNQMVNGYEAGYQQIINNRIHLNDYLDATKVRF